LPNWFKGGGDLCDDEDTHGTSEGTKDKKIELEHNWVVPKSTLQNNLLGENCPPLVNTFSDHISSNVRILTTPSTPRTENMERDLSGPTAGGPTNLG
jgi:hypothetical protein